MTKSDFQSPTGVTKKPRLGDAVFSVANGNPDDNFAFSAPRSENSLAMTQSTLDRYGEPEEGFSKDDGGNATLLEGSNSLSAENNADSWEEIAIQMRQSSFDTNDLENYMKGSTKRREALKRLTLEFGQFSKGLENNVENYALKEVVEKYDQICGSNQTQEAKIRDSFVQNHAKRSKFHAILQNCDHGWKQNSERLFRQINGQHGAESDNVVLPPEQEYDSALNGETLDELPEQEPDWEALKQYKPSRTDIDCFLAGRHRLQLAQERFCQAYDEVQQSLLSINEEVTKILVTSIDSIDVPIDQMENQLQAMLADNFFRRQNMETKIQEAAQKQQGMFQTLMGRVSMKK